MEDVELSIIVVNYNGGDQLLSNLLAFWASHPPTWELVVIDNASSDGSMRDVIKQIADAKIQQNSRNLGFATGSNQGLKQATGKFCLLLNPDVEASTGSIETALAFMKSHPEVGIVGPKILLPNGQTDPACHRSFKTPMTYVYKVSGLSRLFPQSKRFGRYYLSYTKPNREMEVDSVAGAFLMIRRQAMDEIGLLDEDFFMYCEDEDWCWRAKQAGWHVVYLSQVVVRHRKGHSAKQHPVRMTWEWHRSILRYHRKNMAKSYSGVVNGLVYCGIGGTAAVRVGVASLEVALSKIGLRRSASTKTRQSHLKI